MGSRELRSEHDNPALIVRQVSKTFGGVKALRDVSLSILSGEVHGLVGENGSGKSTLIKLLAGFHAPDTPTAVEICGNEVELPLRPGRAHALGLAFVHQELGLIPGMSILENLLIEDFAARNTWCLPWAKLRRRSRRILADFGLSFDPRLPVADLSPTDRALLAIARAAERIRVLAADGEGGLAGVLVLDEPTVYLPEHDRQRLFDLVRTVASKGVAILLVSHDIDEVLAVCDRVTVMRDGSVVGTVRSADSSPEELVTMILGRQAPAPTVKHPVSESASEQGHIQVSGLTGGGMSGFSMDLYEKEILGLTGLPGSGFDELPYLLFGAKPAEGGMLEMNQTRVPLSEMFPHRAIDMRMALIPADRAGAGAVSSLSVADNVSLQVLRQYRRGPALSRSAVARGAEGVANAYDVRPRDPMLKYGSLSGGNQQKALLAKWLQTHPRLLLLHEPTQGVDVGAREDVFRMLRHAADGGCAVVVASTDHEQLAAICSRVLIFRSSGENHELVGSEVTQHAITDLCYASNNGSKGDHEPSR